MNGSRRRLGEKLNFLETNENDLTMTQNLWDTVKAVVSGKFTPIQAYLKKKKLETLQINNLTLHLKEFEEQKRQPRASRRKEITMIRAELNDIETKSRILRINKFRTLFF